MAIANPVNHDVSPSIAELVKTSLQGLGNLQLGRLSCEQQDSTIILSGQLGSFYHSQIAQSVAAKVSGVGRVINQIDVCST